MKAYHICYHTDEDGLASAAVIYEYLKRINKDKKKNVRYFFYRIDYTVDLKTIIPINIPSGDEIYFVDYSFSNEDNFKYILELSNKNIIVTWIDHHKTSYDMVNNFESDILNKYNYPNFNHFIKTDYCGAYLAYVYAYFKLNTNCGTSLFTILDFPKYIPLYIKYVDSWDTWKHNMPYTTEFNIGIRSEKRTPCSVFSTILKHNSNIINKLFSYDKRDIEEIELCMKDYICTILAKGQIIKAYQDVENESICNDYGFEFNIIDHTDSERIYNCFAVNRRGNSTMFGDKINEYDIVVPFQFNGDKYVYSLYTAKNDVDCETLAKKLGSINGLGGGGHVKAAGFQTYQSLIETDCTVHIANKIFRKNKYDIFTAV